MSILRRRPTTLVWYARLRGLSVFLLIIATCSYVALLINPQLGRSQSHKEPLAAVR
jgi:hypothetical protein